MSVLYSTVSRKVYVLTRKCGGSIQIDHYETRQDAERVKKFEGDKTARIHELDIRKTTYDKTLFKLWR